jgi:hypothetical protein
MQSGYDFSVTEGITSNVTALMLLIASVFVM